MAKKMKCYVLMVSRFYPKSEIKAGQRTGLIEAILSGTKIHTIRGNYPWWLKRSIEITEGRGYLSLRYWEGKPCRSKQIEFKRIFRLGVQNVTLAAYAGRSGNIMCCVNNFNDSPYLIPTNDGLTAVDFYSWFFGVFLKDYISFNGVILHFTDFRY